MSADDTGDERDRQSELQRIYDDAYATIERRALIEQTKGMPMFIYGIDADSAFEMLRQQSRQHEIKLRLIAE